jgi:hypothetical protein
MSEQWNKIHKSAHNNRNPDSHRTSASGVRIYTQHSQDILSHVHPLTVIIALHAVSPAECRVGAPDRNRVSECRNLILAIAVRVDVAGCSCARNQGSDRPHRAKTAVLEAVAATRRLVTSECVLAVLATEVGDAFTVAIGARVSREEGRVVIGGLGRLGKN